MRTIDWGKLTRNGLVVLGLALALLVSFTASADSGVAPYQEFIKKIQAAQAISLLKDSVFGDSVDLYTGSTTFQATDVSLPGNSALPVVVGRQLVVEDRTFDPGNLGGFGDWDIDVPWISGTFVAADGWTLATLGNPNDRCSIPAAPDTYYTPAGGNVWLADVWSGNSLHIPGAGNQQLLVNNQAKSPAYASHATYPWVTKGGWKLRCVASLADNYPGEGFVAVSPSGVSYTFNWMIVHAAPDLKLPPSKTQGQLRLRSTQPDLPGRHRSAGPVRQLGQIRVERRSPYRHLQQRWAQHHAQLVGRHDPIGHERCGDVDLQLRHRCRRPAEAERCHPARRFAMGLQLQRHDGFAPTAAR